MCHRLRDSVRAMEPAPPSAAQGPPPRVIANRLLKSGRIVPQISLGRRRSAVVAPRDGPTKGPNNAVVLSEAPRGVFRRWRASWFGRPDAPR
jgi:hypothetical protein